MPARNALISVFDKDGLPQFGQDLSGLDFSVYSSGGTARQLRENGVLVVDTTDYVGQAVASQVFNLLNSLTDQDQISLNETQRSSIARSFGKPVMNHRVATLWPHIHGGILRRDNVDSDIAELEAMCGVPFDLVCVDMYPLAKAIADPNATLESVVEMTDIGGPTLLRSAAKAGRIVICDPADRIWVVEQLRANGDLTAEQRRALAAKTEYTVAKYCLTSAQFLSHGEYDVARLAADMEPKSTDPEDKLFPRVYQPTYRRMHVTRYGENPHQRGAIYERVGSRIPSLVQADVLAENKALSFNNYQDADAVLQMLLEFSAPFACLFKHRNPCGAASGQTLADAYRSALATDPLSAFGCIIGLNQIVDLECAQLVHDTEFVECIIAPGYTPEARDLLMKKKQRRILELPQIIDGRMAGEIVDRPLIGGLLRQEYDNAKLDQAQLAVASKRLPTEAEMMSMLFAWKVAKDTLSNAIVLAVDTATVGIGMGNTSRVDSAFMAVKRAGDRARGAVCASDAFFPKPDGVQVCLDAGVTAFIQPGGSKNDAEAIAAADAAGATMVFTGIRCFKH